ncbi:MAG: GerMN domain-containing protein [Dactylosporangium sp.]|nr:GerMN domain-containing protein [Dactylosporangium sp.]NNJ59384.1 GerMN domain-containing protein [Dactylosporangium sp.]
MIKRIRYLLPLVLTGLLVGGALAVPAAAQPDTPLLVDIRAASHETYDRLVFEFSGPLPAEYGVTSVPEVIGDASGEPVPLVGNAFLAVRFAMATGHDDSGTITYGPPRRAYPLPDIIEVANAGDFEGVLSFGVGLAAQTPFRVFTLTSPSRVVIDLETPFRTVPVQDYFIQNGTLLPQAVSRPVIPPAVARGALQRLFAGPTQAELAAGLHFVGSDATGFTGLSIVDGVARVQLTGGCNSHGATTTIATEIMPTLKQFPSVQWVKIYDPSGQTEEPAGNSDSIPFCLEP